MPDVQTQYTDRMGVAYPGMVADTGPATIVSRTVMDAALTFGKAVARDLPGDDLVHPFTTGDTVVFGIAVRSMATKAGSADAYPVKDTAAILIEGEIWVNAAVAVNPGDPVYVEPTAGIFRKTNANSAVQIANATWETTTSGAALARVRLR